MPSVHALVLNCAAALVALSTTAAAQDYPTKPVRIIVPFPPGAINDTVGRALATHLTERLGKQFIVENRAGAGGIVAGELVANAPKDGHTLMIVSLAITVLPWLHTLPYDTVKSFAPIAIVATAPNVAVVNQELPAKSISELIALAKARPGKLQYASSGVGTFLHLGPELFKLMAGVDILHVPFRGAGPAMIDVIGGHTHMAFASVPSTIAHIRSGKLRALGVGATQRNALIPDVPTISEVGLARLHRRQLDRHRRAGRHAGGHHREAAPGDFGDPGFPRVAEAVRQRGRRPRADELGRVRRAHRERIGQMGTRRERGRHQAGVAASNQVRLKKGR